MMIAGCNPAGCEKVPFFGEFRRIIWGVIKDGGGIVQLGAGVFPGETFS
jgi:hypothetical protein